MFLRVALVVAIAVSSGCNSSAPSVTADQSTAEATLRSFYNAIEAKDADRVVALLRAKEGTPLSTARDKTLRDGLMRVFARAAIHVTATRVVSMRALESDAIALLPTGTSAVRLVFAAEGTGNACISLPINNGTAPFAEIQGRWYVLEDAQFGLPFSAVNC